MITNNAFPRSVRFSANHLEEHLANIEIDFTDRGEGYERVIRQAGKIRAELDYMEKEDIAGQLVDQVLESLKSSCQKLGRTMEVAFSARRD